MAAQEITPTFVTNADKDHAGHIKECLELAFDAGVYDGQKIRQKHNLETVTVSDAKLGDGSKGESTKGCLFLS